MRKSKRLISLVLATLMIAICWISVFASPVEAKTIITLYKGYPKENIKANDSSTQDKYSEYWEYWSQGASKSKGMQGIGCHLVAQAKLLVESGVVSKDKSEFNPDIFFFWAKENGKLDSAYNENKNMQTLISYAKGKATITLLPTVDLNGKTEEQIANMVQKALEDGYYVILQSRKDHPVYVCRNWSLKYKEPILSNSKSGYSVAKGYVETLIGSGNKFSCFYRYKVELKDKQVEAFNSSSDTSVAGYYYLDPLCGNYVSLKASPTETSETLEEIQLGKYIKVTGKGINTYGNVWYKAVYNNKTGYVYPKTSETSGGKNRLIKVTDTFIFENVDPKNIARLSGEKSENWIAAKVYMNTSSSVKIKGYGCIVYKKSGSSYTELARASSTASNVTEIFYYHNYGDSENLKFYDSNNNLFHFEPGTTYYYRYYIKYDDKVYYSRNCVSDENYFSFTNSNVSGKYYIRYKSTDGEEVPSIQFKSYGENKKLCDTVPVSSKGYVLTYNANGGTVSASNKTANRTFKCWNTKADGSGTTYNPGQTYNRNESVELYAQWENPKVGALAIHTRSGYTFLGWFTEPSGGREIKATTSIAANITVYAHWEKQQSGVQPELAPSTRLLYMDLNGEYYARITLNVSGDLPNNYNISYDSKYGKCTIYEDGRTGTGISFVITGTSVGDDRLNFYMTSYGEIIAQTTVDVIIIAKKYTVFYDANGGEGTPYPQTLNCGEPFRASTEIPSKRYTVRYEAYYGNLISFESKYVDCEFLYWSGAPNSDQNGLFVPGVDYYSDSDILLYALWSKANVGNLEEPVRDGYTFTGWRTESGESVTSSTVLTEDITLYACWQQEVILDPRIIVDDNVTAKPGDEVRITVSLKDNPGISAMRLWLLCDKGVELINAEFDTDLIMSNYAQTGWTWSEDDCYGILNWIEPLDQLNITDTVYAVLTFKVSGGISYDRTIDINVICDTDNTFDYNQYSVYFGSGTGSIFVNARNDEQSGEYISGDINKDGEENNKDVVALFRYVSGKNSTGNTVDYDFNGDNEVNNKDVVALFRYLSKISETESGDPDDDYDEEEEEVEYYYYEDLVYVEKPEGYTFKEFLGYPAGLKDGVEEGSVMFNFSKGEPSDPRTYDLAVALLETIRNQIGNYTIDSFSTFSVRGVTVTKLDFAWENRAILQSIVEVYFDDCTAIIQFATTAAFAESKTDFDDMIATLGIFESRVKDSEYDEYNESNPDVWLCDETDIYNTGWWLHPESEVKPDFYWWYIDVNFCAPYTFKGIDMACYADVGSIVNVCLFDEHCNMLEEHEITVNENHANQGNLVHVDFDNTYSGGYYLIEFQYVDGRYFVLGSGGSTDVYTYISGMNLTNQDTLEAPAIKLIGADIVY